MVSCTTVAHLGTRTLPAVTDFELGPNGEAIAQLESQYFLCKRLQFPFGLSKFIWGRPLPESRHHQPLPIR